MYMAALRCFPFSPESHQPESHKKVTYSFLIINFTSIVILLWPTSIEMSNRNVYMFHGKFIKELSSNQPSSNTERLRRVTDDLSRQECTPLDSPDPFRPIMPLHFIHHEHLLVSGQPLLYQNASEGVTFDCS